MIDLEQIVKKYTKAKSSLGEQRRNIKEQIEQQIQTATIKALKIQNHKVSQIHKNQQLIQSRLKRNSEIKLEMQKHMTSWTTIYEQLNKSLKNAGDLAHYASYIEEQIKQICCQMDPYFDKSLEKSKKEQF